MLALVWIALLGLAFTAPPVALIVLVFAWAWSDRTGRRLVPTYRAWSERRDAVRWKMFRTAGRRSWRDTRRRLDASESGTAGSYKVDVRSR